MSSGSVTGTGRGEPGPAGQRNVYLDVLRVLALVRVVTYHTFDAPWLTWVFPAMGVMFALAGSLMARSLDRSAGSAVSNRLRRLLPPFWLFGLIIVPVMLAQGWTADPLRLLFWLVPVVDPPGSAWGGDFTVALWYIRTYLWFVVLSPLALMAFRRWPLPTLVAPLVLVLLADVDLLALPGAAGVVVIDLATFAACWLVGFAHRDGTLQRIRIPVLLGLAGAAMVAGAVWAFTRPAADHAGGLDLSEIPLAQALWSLGFVVVLLRFPLDLEWVARTAVLGRLVATVNARAVTIYLWHNVAIFLSWALINWLDAHRLNEQVNVDGPAFLCAAVLTLIVASVLLFGWVEDIAARRRPRILPTVDARARLSEASAPTTPSAPGG